MQNGQPSLADRFNFVDGNLFDILQVPFVGATAPPPLQTRLTRPDPGRSDQALPNQDALGKTLTLIVQGKSADYVVTGWSGTCQEHTSISGSSPLPSETFFATSPPSSPAGAIRVAGGM